MATLTDEQKAERLREKARKLVERRRKRDEMYELRETRNVNMKRKEPEVEVPEDEVPEVEVST